jgi:ABC-2 type transport system ATP-binding protein
VVYASHLVHDIERVADRIAILDRGKLVLNESLETMKETCRRATAVFENEPPPGIELPGSIDVGAEGRVLTVVARGVDGEIQSALTGAGATRVEVEPIPLEEILVAYLRGGA